MCRANVRLTITIAICALAVIAGVFGFVHGYFTWVQAYAVVAVLGYLTTSVTGPWYEGLHDVWGRGPRQRLVPRGIKVIQIALVPVYLIVIAGFFGLIK